MAVDGAACALEQIAHCEHFPEMMQEGRGLGRPPLPHERLTEGDVAKLLAPGQEGQRLCDGGGLYARRIGDGAAYWVFRFCDRFRGAAEREISLGPQAALSLDNARAIAAGLREQIAAGYLPELPDGRRHGRPVDRSRFKR